MTINTLHPAKPKVLTINIIITIPDQRSAKRQNDLTLFAMVMRDGRRNTYVTLSYIFATLSRTSGKAYNRITFLYLLNSRCKLIGICPCKI